MLQDDYASSRNTEEGKVRAMTNNTGKHTGQNSHQYSGLNSEENMKPTITETIGQKTDSQIGYDTEPDNSPDKVLKTTQNSTIERGIAKHIVRTIIFLGIIMLISGGFRFFLGYIYGVVVSLLIMIHSYSSIKKALNMGQKTAKPYMFGGYSLHYLVYGLTLWAAFQSKHLNFVSTVFGLLTTKIGLFSWAFMNWLGPEYKSWLKKFTGRYDFNSLRK